MSAARVPASRRRVEDLSPADIYRRGPAGQADYLCPACDQRPCYDGCPEQRFIETLSMKATRANLLGGPVDWLARHADWVERFPNHPCADEARALAAQGRERVRAAVAVAAGDVVDGGER